MQARGNPAITLAALPVAVLIAGTRLRYGFSPDGDEGFHLASAARYLLGDRPFWDEHFTTPISADLLLAAMMAAAPVDTVLWWRAVGLGLMCLATLVLVAGLIRRAVSRWVATAVGIMLVLFAPFNLWVPNYKNLPIVFLVMALSAVLVAGRDTRAIIVSGVLYVLATICYLPLAGLWFPIAATYPLWRDKADRRQLIRWLATVVACGLALGGILLAGGYLDQAVANVREKMLFPQYQLSVLERLRNRLLGHALFLGFGCVGAAVAAAVAMQSWEPFSKRAAGVLRASGRVLLAGTFVTLTVLFWRSIGRPGLEGSYPTLSPWLFLLHFAASLALAGFAWAQGRGVLPFALSAFGPLAVGWLAGTVFFMSSASWASSIAEANVCSWLLWTGGALMSAKLVALASDPVRRRNLQVFQFAYLGCSVAVALIHLWGWSFEDGKPTSLQATYHDAKLAGLRSTRERVQTVEHLLAEARKWVRPGDFVVGYEKLFGLSYLLDARPAMYATFVHYNNPPEPMMERWLGEMTARQRVPKLVVTPRVGKPRDSFERFLVTNYRAEGRYGEYVLWRNAIVQGNEPSANKP